VNHVNHMILPFSIVDIHALYGGKTLAGTGAGKSFFAKLLEATGDLNQGTIVGFDLRKTDLVTASFFRVSFKAFRDHARSTTGVYPVHICTSGPTLEEVKAYADDVRDAFIFGDLDDRSELRAPFIIGPMEEKQARTLMYLEDLGEADAATMYTRYPEVPPLTSSAAWSNRLASLANKGLVVERSEGRSKIYRPIAKGIRYGL
jgi:hypothetical protein